MALLKGWNMVGNRLRPSCRGLKLNVTPGQAVRDYGWAYDATTNGYQLVTDMVGLESGPRWPAARASGSIPTASAPHHRRRQQQRGRRPVTDPQPGHR